jgi:YggT family protein
MFALGNLLLAVARVLELLLWGYFFIVIARAVISWVSPDPFNPLVRFLYRATEPVLRPIRRRLPMTGMGLDLSPMIVILAIYFLQAFVVETIRDLGLSLR